jgi:CRP-like cAMP-binding protein
MDVPAHPVDTPRQNWLLAAFPEAAWQRLEGHLQPVWLTLGQWLCEPGIELAQAYFPTSAIVSLLNITADGHATATAVVGNEGLVGMALYMGGESTPDAAVVANAGWAYRLQTERLKEEFSRNGDVMRLLLRYTQALLTQMSQTAACNRHHSVEQQLCRWLLLSLDRAESNTLDMTHELIAQMLGVRREGVTEAAGKLQTLGVIQYHRGHMTVIDRPHLELLCCECYGVVAREYDRLLDTHRPATPHMVPTPSQSPAYDADRHGRCAGGLTVGKLPAGVRRLSASTAGPLRGVTPRSSFRKPAHTTT